MARFQKCLKNDFGKKYFIDVIQHDNDYMPEHYKQGEWWTKYTYEYETQMYSRNDHKALDFLFHSDWTLEEVEEHLEKLFQTGMYDYYEKWYDDEGGEDYE